MNFRERKCDQEPKLSSPETRLNSVEKPSTSDRISIDHGLKEREIEGAHKCQNQLGSINRTHCVVYMLHENRPSCC